MSTQRTTLLIVGAGPTGLTAAISLVNSGFRDFVIVDSAASRGEASRAIAIHAATLEALDAIDCAEPLIKLGIKGQRQQISNRSGVILQTEMSSLAPYTRYPFALIISQRTTEQVLEKHLQDLGIQILRPEKAVGLKCTDNGDLDVSFESGNVISARYVVAADGARSVIRQMTGIGFTDPDGMAPDERLAQMVLADVAFSSDSPSLPKDTTVVVASDNKFFIIVPLPRDPGSTEVVYRIGFNVPLSAGPPLSNPSTAYLQQYVDQAGPVYLSSDPSVNPDPIRIARTVWSTRFRTHSAIADRFMVRMGNDEAKKNKGIVLLIGDAAHIHSPAGGQGMNLGIRDAAGLGPVLAAHIASTDETLSGNDRFLEDYASTRRQRALTTIRLTKRIMATSGMAGSTTLLGNLAVLVIKLLGRLPFVRRNVVWNISGLGNR